MQILRTKTIFKQKNIEPKITTTSNHPNYNMSMKIHPKLRQKIKIKIKFKSTTFFQQIKKLKNK